MDTEFARTFLAVVAAGSFSNAAGRMHVTQSTVSSRIATLEESLGVTLFVRNKGGTTLTPAGRWFQKHATTLVRTVAQARQDLGTAKSFRGSLTVGGRFGLWEELLIKWLPRMREAAPDVSIRAEIGFEEDLMQGLVEGRLDVGVMYTPQSRPGLGVEQLFEEDLVLVSSKREQIALDEGYVHVDWGPEFHAKHSVSFPDFEGSAITVNIGWLGLAHVLVNGGSGYFPIRLTQQYLAAARLYRAVDAPAFSLPVYMVYPLEMDPEVTGIALSTIRRAANEHISAA
jgi:DNA-binding transcriptional LysR family regulator